MMKFILKIKGNVTVKQLRDNLERIHCNCHCYSTITLTSRKLIFTLKLMKPNIFFIPSLLDLHQIILTHTHTSTFLFVRSTFFVTFAIENRILVLDAGWLPPILLFF